MEGDVSTRYHYTSEPIACEQADGKIVVTSRLTGSFPGSPVNLRFCIGAGSQHVVVRPRRHAGEHRWHDGV
jgi:hypothetical protein